MAKRFTLQDHFDRAARDRRHFIRAMVMWSKSHTDRSHTHAGVLYLHDGKGGFRVSRDFTFEEGMCLAITTWLTCGTAKQPKEARRNMIKWMRDFRQPFPIPA